MTPDELQKEAERIIRECLEGWYDPESKFEDDGRRFYSEADEIICRALRAAHEAGFNEAKERAEKIVQVRIDERYSSDCQVEAEQMRDEIRAVNSGDGEIYGR